MQLQHQGITGIYPVYEQEEQKILLHMLLQVSRYMVYKCKKHFIKMLKDVGMVVPKIKETRL